MNTIWFVLILVAVTAPFVVWVVIRSRPEPPGVFVDPKSPEWMHAVSKAQASVASLRQLFEEKQYLVGVKYSLDNSQGAQEHVWGELLELSNDSFLASLETPLRKGKPTGDPPFRLPLSKLADWQVVLPDGSVRGGFTTRVDIAHARQHGVELPPHMTAMEGRFVDA